MNLSYFILTFTIHTAGLLTYFIPTSSTESTTSHDDLPIVIVILSQPNTYHARKAHESKANITKQAKEQNLPPPAIHLLHEDWHSVGAWTLFPILKDLADQHGKNSLWIFFCEEHTQVSYQKLRGILGNYNHSKDWFLGHALYDQDATIIHHFAFSDNTHEFAYPDFSTGFAINTKLLTRLSKKWLKVPNHLDFSIDPKYELALYLMRYLNVNLTHVPEFCVKPSVNCITYCSTTLATCGPKVPISEMYFAVKTCEKFHDERVPIVKSTWGLDSAHIEYFSNKADSVIPTRDLKIPNTEKGHCAKTLGILTYASSRPDIMSKSWLILADDDTLLSVPRMQRLLSCYDAVDSVVIGERYGYSVTSNEGYNYITGGGGIVFSTSVVRQLVDGGLCSCPTDDTPDDMFLGICLKRLGIPLTHSPLFHQARPMDYAEDYLIHQQPISFHKHWMMDPLEIYTQWLKELDPDNHRNLHTEL